MNKDLAKIEFYFPKGDFQQKEDIVDGIVSQMTKNDSLGYCGYADTALLREGLLDHLGKGDVHQYQTLSEEHQGIIEDTVYAAIEKSNEQLPLPTKNFVFVHPYLPEESDRVFEGVMAVAVYSCVFHIFVDLSSYTRKSLENTVAHELNHTIFYYHHYDDLNNYTLLDEVLLEGLAENFREQYFDSATTKWAGALTKQEARSVLEGLGPEQLHSRSQTTIKGILFGDKTYKKWTGYSIGYWLVKIFREKNPNLSWDDLMKLPSDEFIKVLE